MSYALACFPYGWGHFILHVLWLLLLFYYVVCVDIRNYHFKNKDIKIQKTSTRFKDIIGGGNQASTSTKRRSRTSSATSRTRRSFRKSGRRFQRVFF